MCKFKVALIQMDIALGQIELNQNKAMRLIDQACDKGANLIVLPELWTSGYDLAKAKQLVAGDNGSTLKILSEKAKNRQVEIAAGSILEEESGKIYNSLYYFNAQGAVQGCYRKIHLFGLMKEDKYLTAGKETTLIASKYGKLGLEICYDLRFPEFSRKLTLMGAQALIIPAEFPNPRRNHWRTLNLARAIENQLFVFAVNRVGADRESSFFGSSMIIDPWGEVLAEGGDQEEIIIAEVDFSLVDSIRKNITSLEDRRPECY